MAGGLPRLLSDGTHIFVWGANRLAYNLTLGSSPTVQAYHADQIGSIREGTASSGRRNNNDLARRQAKHFAARGQNFILREVQGLGDTLTRAQARAVEQVLIQECGLERLGGQLLKKYNSISEGRQAVTGWATQTGTQLLQETANFQK